MRLALGKKKGVRAAPAGPPYRPLHETQPHSGLRHASGEYPKPGVHGPIRHAPPRPLTGPSLSRHPEGLRTLPGPRPRRPEDPPQSDGGRREGTSDPSAPIYLRAQSFWFGARSKPGLQSQATPPLGVSRQMWAQPWSLFMQFMPSEERQRRVGDRAEKGREEVSG